MNWKYISLNDAGFPERDDERPLFFHRDLLLMYAEQKKADCGILLDTQTGVQIPLAIRKMLTFKYAQFLFTPFPSIEAEQEHVLFESALQFLREQLKIDRVIQPHPVAFSKSVPTGSEWCRFGTYQTRLQNKTEEDLLGEFDSKYRKAVQHSVKNGGRVEIGRQVLGDFYTLYTETTQKAGIHRDELSYFENYFNVLGEERVSCAVVYDASDPVGAVFIPYTRHTAWCTHAGSGGPNRLYGAMKHLHWNMMTYLRDRGVERYDLAGVRLNSSNEALAGIFRFKKGFGGELIEGYLWKKDLNAIACHTWDSLVRLKNKGKSPAMDIIDQEKGTISC